jgi:hypothetical protein
MQKQSQAETDLALLPQDFEEIRMLPMFARICRGIEPDAPLDSTAGERPNFLTTQWGGRRLC